MAINLKLETKIVEVVNNVQIQREVFAHSASDPIFRQNGYEVNGDKKPFAIAFDSVENEYLDVDTQVNWLNLSEVNFKVTIEITGLSSATQIIYCDGGFKDSVNGSGLFRMIINPNVYTMFVYTSGTNNANAINIAPATLGVGIYEIEVSNLNIIVNGSIVHTYAEQQINLTSTAYKPTISKASYLDDFYSDFQYKTLEINGKKYLLTEGLGNEVWSEDKTDKGTLYTNHAGGVDRINFGMWLKGDDVNGWTPYTI